MHNTLYLIDGSNLAFRAHCTHTGLTVEGIPVGATYGTVRLLSTFVKGWPPGRIVMPFDVSKSDYRLGLYPEYKGARADNKRKQLYDEYIGQLDFLISLASDLGVTTISQESRGIEADDVIAYIVHRFLAGHLACTRIVIVSSDKDLCALVSANVVWHDPIRTTTVSIKNFEETFGVPVTQYLDFKAMKGDSSDNIPGVKGVGAVNAAKLLKEYGNLETLLGIKHTKVEASRREVVLAKQLMALNLHDLFPHHPAWQKIDNRLQHPPGVASNILETFETLQFNSVLADWPDLGPRFAQFSQPTLLK